VLPATNLEGQITVCYKRTVENAASKKPAPQTNLTDSGTLRDTMDELTRHVRLRIGVPVENYLIQHRPGNRAGRPFYTDDEISSLASALVRHQLEGVRHVLLSQKNSDEPLELDKSTLLPADQPPAWLEYDRESLEAGAPVSRHELQAIIHDLCAEMRTRAERSSGLSLGDCISITYDRDHDAYHAAYDRPRRDASQSLSEQATAARTKVWKQVVKDLHAMPLKDLVLGAWKELEAPTTALLSVDSLTPTERQALKQLGRERQALMAARQWAARLRPSATSEPESQTSHLALLATAVSSLAAQSRPNGLFGDVDIFRLITLRAMQEVVDVLTPHEAVSVSSQAQQEKAEVHDFTLERVLALRMAEEERPPSDRTRVIIGEARQFLSSYNYDWLRPELSDDLIPAE